MNGNATSREFQKKEKRATLINAIIPKTESDVFSFGGDFFILIISLILSVLIRETPGPSNL